MANNDFIISTLNISAQQIRSLSTVKKDQKFYIQVELVPEYPECPFCGGKVKIKDHSRYKYNHMDIAGIPSVIDWKRTRYICKDCQRTFSETSPFGPEHFHQSYAVLNAIALDLHNYHLSFYDIALRHHVSDTIVQLYTDSFIKVPKLTLPENIGIDEISSSMSKYGGSYLCVIVDNKGRMLHDIIPNRSKLTLSRYFEAIPLEERNKVRYVTIDMWEPYKQVCSKYLKNCEISVDPFHVIKHLTEGFTKLRVSIMNQCVYNSTSYYLLKSWHKLLESDKYDLDNEPRYNSKFKQHMNYRDLYELTLKISEELKLAYELKEMYRDFNKNCSYEEAPARLDYLIDLFEEADLACYKEFVQLLKNWKPEIINSFNRPYDSRRQSNALDESYNQKLREFMGVSNGYSNYDRFRARALYCFNDRIFYSLTANLKSNKRQGKKRCTYKKITPDPISRSSDECTEDDSHE